MRRKKGNLLGKKKRCLHLVLEWGEGTRKGEKLDLSLQGNNDVRGEGKIEGGFLREPRAGRKSSGRGG